MINNEINPSKSGMNVKHYLALFLLGIAAVLTIAALDSYFRGRTSGDQMTATQETGSLTQMDSAPSNEVDDTSMLEPDGRYLEFAPEYLESKKDTRRVLFFYASWCPTCATAHASFIENSAQIPADVTLLRVNYNDPQTDQIEKDLAETYGITYQHSFVEIDAEGTAVTTWNGGEIDEFLANIE